MPWYMPVEAPTASFKIDVDWPLNTVDDEWVNLPADERKLTGIVRYRVLKISGNLLFDYCLEIDSELENYDYQFTGGEPDTYNLKSSVTGTHTVKYNSPSPGIKKIWGGRAKPHSDYDYSA